MNNLEHTFLGRGWSFPPTFDKNKKGVEMSANEVDIKSSLEILLSTRLGERIMRPEYGANLEELLFETLNTTLETYITGLIRTAIVFHEPRIVLEKVSLDQAPRNEGIVLIQISYTVRSTNTRENFVYPFYKEEATNL